MSPLLIIIALTSSLLMQACAASASSASNTSQAQANGHINNVEPPADAPPLPPDAPPQPNHIDALLEELERSAADLTAFTAAITYEKHDDLLNRKETRTGELIYRRADNGSKSFAILFDSEIVGDRRTKRLKHYIFDGRWLAEIDHQNKQFIKREIVAPGRQLDPLKLGEGPIPLPIGQAKKDVLARFEVKEAKAPQDGLLRDLQNVDGLLLIPKPNTPEAKDFERVELFYDRQTRLPVGIITIETSGDRKTVRLKDVKRNPQLDEATLKKLDIAEPNPREWQISIQPWGG